MTATKFPINFNEKDYSSSLESATQTNRGDEWKNHMINT